MLRLFSNWNRYFLADTRISGSADTTELYKTLQADQGKLDKLAAKKQTKDVLQAESTILFKDAVAVERAGLLPPEYKPLVEALLRDVSKGKIPTPEQIKVLDRLVEDAMARLQGSTPAAAVDAEAIKTLPDVSRKGDVPTDSATIDTQYQTVNSNYDSVLAAGQAATTDVTVAMVERPRTFKRLEEVITECEKQINCIQNQLIPALERKQADLDTRIKARAEALTKELKGKGLGDDAIKAVLETDPQLRQLTDEKNAIDGKIGGLREMASKLGEARVQGLKNLQEVRTIVQNEIERLSGVQDVEKKLTEARDKLGKLEAELQGAPAEKVASLKKQVEALKKEMVDAMTALRDLYKEKHGSPGSIEMLQKQIDKLNCLGTDNAAEAIKTIQESEKVVAKTLDQELAKGKISRVEKDALLGLSKEVDKTIASHQSFLSKAKIRDDELAAELKKAREGIAVRAKETNAELQKLQQDEGKDRLSDDVVKLLTDAVGTSRTGNIRGVAGIMGKDAAMRAAKALMEMSPEEYKKTMALLQAAETGAKDPGLEKALILKAIGANYKKPSSFLFWSSKTDQARNDQFFKNLEAFSKGMHGMERADLIRRTTLTGVEAGGASLQQRYHMSCAPTTIQMLKGEQDPMYAWQITQEGPPQSLDASGQTAAEQKTWLETDGGGKAIPRQAMENYKRLSDDIASRIPALVATVPPPPDLADKLKALATLKQYMDGLIPAPSDDQKKQIDQALADLKAAAGGGTYPGRAEVDTIQGLVKSYGLPTFQGGGTGMAISDALGKRTGREYECKGVMDAANDVKSEYLDKAAESLKAGKGVPLRIGYTPSHDAGHAMLMSDVRGASPNREYLVSDPYSGTTQWVKEADLKSGAFANDPKYGFELGNANVTHMYFPK